MPRVRVGLDGFNAIHNYESFCRCQHCTDYIRAYLRRTQALQPAQLLALFGTRDIDGIHSRGIRGSVSGQALISLIPLAVPSNEVDLELWVGEENYVRRVRIVGPVVAQDSPEDLGFHPSYMIHDLPRTSTGHAERALAEAQAAGLTNVRIGNRHLLSREY